MSKPSNIGSGVGGTSITSIGKSIALNTQNQKCMPNSQGFKDAVTVKTLMDSQVTQEKWFKSPKDHVLRLRNDPISIRRQSDTNTSYDKNKIINSFRQSGKLPIQNDSKERIIKSNFENNARVCNVKYSKLEHFDARNNSADAKNMFTPNHIPNKDPSNNTVAMTRTAGHRPPSMRIKRSSSKKKKNSQFFGSAEVTTTAKNRSTDSRDKNNAKLNNIKSHDEFYKNSNMDPARTFNINQSKYLNNFNKQDLGAGYIEVKPTWDKRFIEHTSRGISFDLFINPDANYMKRILENEKDER